MIILVTLLPLGASRLQLFSPSVSQQTAPRLKGGGSVAYEHSSMRVGSSPVAAGPSAAVEGLGWGLRLALPLGMRAPHGMSPPRLVF